MYSKYFERFKDRTFKPNGMNWLSEPVESFHGDDLAKVIMSTIEYVISEYESSNLEEDKVYELSHQPTIDALELLSFHPDCFTIFNKNIEIVSKPVRKAKDANEYYVRFFLGEYNTFRCEVINNEQIPLPEFDRFYIYTSPSELVLIMSYITSFYGKLLTPNES